MTVSLLRLATGDKHGRLVLPEGTKTERFLTINLFLYLVLPGLYFITLFTREKVSVGTELCLVGDRFGIGNPLRLMLLPGEPCRSYQRLAIQQRSRPGQSPD